MTLVPFIFRDGLPVLQVGAIESQPPYNTRKTLRFLCMERRGLVFGFWFMDPLEIFQGPEHLTDPDFV
jgi:hypothetical protein